MIPATSFTQPLSDCRDTSLVGGKAANLGRLLRAGFPVPAGFVVTTRAYCLAQVQSSAGDVADTLPLAVADELKHTYRAMGGGRVAVRSSATAEDGADASMAGQYETFLDVQGESGLLDAVRQCWASLDTPRALAYLREHEIDPSSVAMAVVVQRLVPADVAGVLFTSNPHDGGHREMLVEAGLGLGEAVVSGHIQPDTLRVDQETGRVLAATIADNHRSAAVRDDRQEDESPPRQSCLDGREVYRLWQLGRRIVEHFGAPQDIEWAIHAGRLYVLQSRADYHARRGRVPRKRAASGPATLAPGIGGWTRAVGAAQSGGNALPSDAVDVERYPPFHVGSRGTGRHVSPGRFRALGDGRSRRIPGADRWTRLHGCISRAGNVLRGLPFRLRRGRP